MIKITKIKDNRDDVYISSSAGAQTFVNGRLLDGRQLLKTGSRIIFGAAHVFRFVQPSKIHAQMDLPCSDDTPQNGLCC